MDRGGKESVARIVEKNYNSFAALCVKPWRTRGGKGPGRKDSVERGAGVAQRNRAELQVL
jgi:hypothetical protein